MREGQVRATRTWDPAQRHGSRWRILAFAVVPLLLAGLAVWFGSEYRRLGSSEDDSQRAHQRQLLFSELFSSLKDAETGQRGYVLTGREAFLDPYSQGRAEARLRLEELADLPTTPEEVRRLERFGGLVDAKFAEMERVIDIRRQSGLEAAAATVAEGRGKRLMDDIRREAAAARKAEEGRLERTLARQNARTQQTIQIFWVVVILVSLIFLVLGVLWWRNDRERRVLERQAYESATRRRAIFENTLDAIVLINPSGSIETINRSAAELFGYADADLIRRDISLIVDLAPGDGPFLDRIGLGEEGLADPFRHNMAARRADGSRVPVEIALGLMELPDGIHIVAAFRDISEREKAERIKDQFLSTVSHELRTPLTSIVGSLGLLRGGVNGELSAGAQRLVVIAENNANRLIRLVNDLLDIEKLESGSMSFEFAPIDLRDVAAKAIDGVRGLAQENAITLDIQQDAAPVVVRGDSDRLVQVMTNLLANAVRFSPAGETVTLFVRRRAGHAEAAVADKGPGIDEELRGRLFTRFAQSIQAPAGGTRGTGLGLAISREIVRNHGGSIWYEANFGGGSVFNFSLPLWNDVTGQSDHQCAPRVLICAAPGEAAAVIGALENRAIRADVVEDGAGVIRALKDHRYLAVLVDCHCLQTEGAELFHLIRRDPETRDLPIIALAAGEAPETPAYASLDLVDWIPRPVDQARLNDAIASIVDRATASMPLVLHVDDDTDTLEITASALAGRVRMARATDLASARAFMAQNRPDVVIIDLGLPDGSGEELVSDLSLTGTSATPVIIYSAQERGGDFAREVSAVLTKSRRSLSALVETITGILDQREGQGRQR